MDILEKLRMPLKCRTVDGVDIEYHPCEPLDDLLEQAANEIERLRSIAGAVTAGPTAAETLAPLRHKAPAP